MSVRFTLVDKQLKLLKHGLQSLHKIGSELLLEALPARVILRSINSSLSAYLSVTYNAAFFDSYGVLDCNIVQAGLMLKDFLVALRSQRVAKVLFDLNTATNKATITVDCENGLVKRYRLITLDSEILQATVDKRQFAVRLTAEAAAMSRLLSSFHGGLEEITLLVLPDGNDRPVQLNSFVDPQKGQLDKSLYTSVQVDPAETFLAYFNSAEEPRDVTINLKDFKAMLNLCEALGTHISLCFDSPGNPLVAEPALANAHAQEVDYEAELILSTLLESHGGPAARMAAARAAAAAAPAANEYGMAAADMRTPAAALMANSPGGEDVPSALPSGRTAARRSGRSAELGFSPAPGPGGRLLAGATAARPTSAAAGQSRFAQEAQLHDPQLPAGDGLQYAQQPYQPQQPRQQQQHSGLVDDGSLWAAATTASGSQRQQQQQPQASGLDPLGGDAGPRAGGAQRGMAYWEDEVGSQGAVPSSPQDPGTLPTLAPGAIV